jgi:dihydropyrimidinase
MNTDIDLVISNGTLVTAADTFSADVGIHNGKIVSIGQKLTGTEKIDATGMLVLPGGVDPHVHLAMSTGQTTSSDDFSSGTIAAACGGTTTIIDFIEPTPGETLLDALANRRSQADGLSVLDYALHMTLTNARPDTLAQLPDVFQAGCTSFKTYLTYKDLMIKDSDFIQVLKAVHALGGLVLVHAENDAIIKFLTDHYVKEGCSEPRYHALSRPSGTEVEAVTRAIALAEVAGSPLYIVHVSTIAAAQAIAEARRRGIMIYGETCPQYLLLTAAELDRPGFEGAKYICSPPLRSTEDNLILWQALANGVLQTVGTDHCPFNYVGQKDLGRDTFTKIPGGIPGIESRLALLYTYGVRPGILSLNRWVQLCSTAPSEIFGLYPRKGSLAPGSDADIVIFDPEKSITISADLLHERVDYSPYEGLKLHGYPVITLRCGEVIVQEGVYLPDTGFGKFLKR